MSVKAPWYTGAMIDMLSRRDLSGLKVFEYGGGYSSLWWREAGCQVTVCEHNIAWYNWILEHADSNLTCFHSQLPPDGSYPSMALHSNPPFDIVVIDGRCRVQCAAPAMESLSPSGVIIWDNTTRKRYRAGLKWLRSQGFIQWNYSQIGSAGHWWQTSVLFRPQNCLGIEEALS